MKYFETKIMCMQENEITANRAEGMPSKEYPNCGIYGYHDFFELEFFIGGYGVHYINSIPYEVKRGYMYLLFPGDSHHKILDESIKFDLCNLKLDVKVPNKALIDELKEFPRPLCVYLDEKNAELVLNEFNFLIDILKNKLYNKKMAENVAERLLNFMLCSLDKSTALEHKITDEPIGNIIKYIEKNYSLNIKLSDIAKILDISESYAGVYFKKHTGVTFVNFLTSTRLSHALSLLKETNLSIKEISFRTGFSSPEYFTRLFTASFSKAPKEYRKENKL